MQSFCYTRHQKKEILIDFLIQRFPYQNESHWRQAIKSGAIKLNHKKTKAETLLKSKDVISYERPRSAEPEVDTDYNILHLDDSIVVVEKNGNIPIAESGRYYRNTLTNILKEKEGYPELYAVHRLDKETSGVLLIARTKEVATKLGEQFFNQIPKKEYHALLQGEFAQESVMVDEPIKKCHQEQSKIRIRQVVDEKGKASKSLFEVVKVGKDLTLTKVRTFTGRTHQIRCHANHIGHPIMGDKLYGQSDDDFVGLLTGAKEPIFSPYGRLDRQLLHASSLSFIHPETGQEMTFKSDYYKEFSKFAAIKQWLDT